jgi:hypothetical protein
MKRYLKASMVIHINGTHIVMDNASCVIGGAA